MVPRLLLRAACCLLLAAWVAGVDAAPLLKPGTEGAFPLAGASKDCVLYVPSDYVRGTPTPLILFMHGSGGSPTTEPFKSITAGKGYLVCGLSYGAQADAGARGIRMDEATVKAEIAFFRRVRAAIDRTYGIDQHHVILTGLSMGGWGVNGYGLTKEAAGEYCAYAIFAAGAQKDATLSVAAGLPVLVLNGSEDPNLPVAKQGMPFLRNAGAIATQVVLPGQPHVPSIESMRGPVVAWLEQVAKTLPVDPTLSAGHWIDAAPPAQAPAKGDARAALAQWLASIPEVAQALVDKPVLILAYGAADGATAGSGPSAGGGGMSRVDVLRHAFSYPTAVQTPLALAHFQCITLDVSGLDRAHSHLLSAETAPCVLILGKTLGTVLKGGRLTDSAIAAEMKHFLSATEIATWERQQQQVTPTITSLRTTLKKLTSAQNALLTLRATPADDAVQPQKDKAVAAQEAKVEQLQTTYDTLRQQLQDTLKTL